MILGLEITIQAIAVGGIFVFVLLLFQVLAGLRIIKLGRKNRVIHKWTGIAVLVMAALHGLLGIVFGFGLKIF